MDVQHDPTRHRFFLEVAGGTAELSYRPLDARTAGRAPEAGGKVAHPAIVPLRNRQQRCGFGPSVGYAFATGTRDW